MKKFIMDKFACEQHVHSYYCYHRAIDLSVVVAIHQVGLNLQYLTP